MLGHIHGKIASGMDLDSHELEALIQSLPEDTHHRRLEDARFEIIRSTFKVGSRTYSLRWLCQSDAPEGQDCIVRQYGQPLLES